MLSVIGCIWYFAFCRQMFRSYGRFHQNALAQSRGGALLPALPIVPQFAPKLALGVALVAVRAAILRPFVAGPDRLLIYILLDAAAIKQLLPQRTWAVALPVYSLAVAAFVLLTIRGFFRRNQKQYRKFSAP